MATQSTIYLVTGANRGIGLGLVNAIAERDQHAIIYAGVRDPAKATQLEDLTRKYLGRIQIVKYVSGNVEGNQAVAKEIDEKHGRVDVVIANAGISNYYGPVSETPVEEMRVHFEVNALGVFVLFQAMFALLKRSANPKFIPITSGAGSLTVFIEVPLGNTTYAMSKVALNYLSRRIHFENEWLTCFPLAPGIVDTDMAALSLALDKTGALTSIINQLQVSTVDEASAMLANIIQVSTRAIHGGEFMNVDGSKIPW